MFTAHLATDRTVLRLSGADARGFLQDLVTNDVSRLDEGPVYAALLTPQGKYLADFLLVAQGDAILLDADADQAAALAQRLTMYKLRAKVEIAQTDLRVVIGPADAPLPPGAVRDPRDRGLGWRHYSEASETGPDSAAAAAYDAARIALGVPRAGTELLPNDSYILEAGFDRLNGVDFRKGCYVGQEVTARMRHKTELRKGMRRLALDGPAPAAGTVIERDGKPVGTLTSSADGMALGHLRFDRIGPGMTAGNAAVAILDES